MRKFMTVMACLCLAISQLHAQTRTVTGKVTDEKNVPLSGVTITVLAADRKVTSTSVSDANGNFSARITDGSRSLQFSSIGLDELNVPIAGKTSFSITLHTNAGSNLSEVVVVGYGTQRRGELTASVSKINTAPIADEVTTSIDKQLGGRATGVQVTNPSGLVDQPARIRIRGANSATGGRDPLYVLDGIPIASQGFSGVTNDNLLGDINPNDIESIEVLKDGSATAIYGSRASNGVILITTKKGRSGAARVTYSGNFAFGNVAKKFDVLNADQFVTIANEKLINGGGVAQAFNPHGYNTDWQSLVTRKTFSQVHGLSVEGGNDRTNYFFSFNYSNQQGTVITNAAKRFGIRGNIDQKVGNWLKISNYITLARTEDFDQNNGGNSLSGAIYNAIRALPDVRAFDPTNTKFGGYNITADGTALGQDDNTKLIDNNNTNIAYVLAHNKFQSTKYRIIDNIGLDIKPFSWLTYYAKANIDYATDVDFEALDPLHGDGKSQNGVVLNQSINSLQYVLQNYLTAAKRFGKHNITATVGSELQDAKANSFFAQGTNISDPFFLTSNIISNSFATQFSGGSYSEGPGFVSYFGRVNYDYEGKYFIQGSFRRDGLSRFADGNRYGTFPGVSVGYRISQENFWKTSGMSDIFSDLKLRASLARVGNQNISGGNFPFLSTYGSAPYGAVSGIAANQVGNPTLLWETSDKLDFGLDVTLWKNRLNITADYFQNKDNNLVFQVQTAPSLGVPGNQVFKNIGALQNTGFELAVNANLVQGRDFSLNVGANFTAQQNKMLTLPNGGADISSSFAASGGTYNVIRLNQPLFAIYGYNYAGVNSLNGNPMYTKADGTLIQGNLPTSSYFLVNKDGSLGAATTLAGTDRALLGSPLPTWFGGFTADLKYKNFSLSMLWRYSGGNKIMNITRQESVDNQGFLNSGTELLARWQKAGDVTNVPKLWYGRDNFINLTQSANSRFVESGDFLRLDNLIVSYTFGQSVLKSASYIRSFRLFIQGQNLWTITKYKGIDPDNINEQGIDYNVTPPVRLISVGVNVGF